MRDTSRICIIAESLANQNMYRLWGELPAQNQMARAVFHIPCSLCAGRQMHHVMTAAMNRNPAGTVYAPCPSLLAEARRAKERALCPLVPSYYLYTGNKK